MIKTGALKELVWGRIKRALYAPIPVVPDQRSALANALMQMALVGAVGYGLHGLSDAASKAVGSVENTLAKGVAFQNMMDASEAVRMNDPAKVKNMFDVVYQFFPAGAAQAHTAAGIVSNMAQYDTVDHKTIKDLVDMQKSYLEISRGLPRPGDPLSSTMTSAFARGLVG